ncbi:bifunctional nicotinamide-nucleotide adenylyltransferase/Nudix hydroxylase [Pontixanthobacter luteolus]|uniref:bifunctional nicotinamide-nucleotide adenylyltransferase/Nudix hydroxylase n=1 Tax=Pontixanthobacter luteolus TaxID=295089 RepID=UPI0023023E0D|nr:bifunctional nicotinamide-nucleotide adenylyltransferase/Nudix hydroxylase [Pontixanthobacter luteolus]
MANKASFGVFIGRFQPLHIGHEYVIRKSLEQVDRLIVLVGSANVARDPRNPFTYEEREHMIRSAFAYEMAQGQVMVEPLDDHLYSDNAWTAEVQRRVHEIVLAEGNSGFQANGLDDFSISLSGFGKDQSSYYLKMFPAWGNIQIDSQYGTFSSADIRERFFARIPEVPDSILSKGVAEQLHAFKMSEPFKALLAEREYLDAYPAEWGEGPFVTADAVVIQSGHILLVERGRLPGKGLLALPGGFVNRDERVRDAAIRELREETEIGDSKGQIPPAMLASFIEDSRSRIFDAPGRSLRGRIITHAFLFRLPERRKLFKVKGGDDAAHARWYRLGELKPEMLFEDHWSIIEQMADL